MTAIQTIRVPDHALRRFRRYKRLDSGSMIELPDWLRAANLYRAKLMVESDRMPAMEKALLVRDLAERITSDAGLSDKIGAAVLDRLNQRDIADDPTDLMTDADEAVFERTA